MSTATCHDCRHEWETAPDWAHKEADEWVAKDAAFRLLIGIEAGVESDDNDLTADDVAVVREQLNA